MSPCFPLRSGDRALTSAAPRLECADHDSLSPAHDSMCGERHSLTDFLHIMKGNRAIDNNAPHWRRYGADTRYAS